MQQVDPARPALSVIIPTRRGMPWMQLPLDALRDQATRLGADVIVMDGSDRPAPSPADLDEHVRWMSRPGESVFELRESGWPEARGDLIAVTEDHCEPAADWLEAIALSHAEHPEALAIGGAVENGTTDLALDWAAFLMTQSPFMPPFDATSTRLASGGANASYKRAALEQRVEAAATDDPMRFLALRPLAGEELVADDRIVVYHHQSMGVRATSAIEFHNGRTIGGYRRSQMGKGDWVRVGGASVLPLWRTFRTMRSARRKQRTDVALRSLPWQLWLQYCNGAGELLGYITGPGRSPNELN